MEDHPHIHSIPIPMWSPWMGIPILTAALLSSPYSPSKKTTSHKRWRGPNTIDPPRSLKLERTGLTGPMERLRLWTRILLRCPSRLFTLRHVLYTIPLRTFISSCSLNHRLYADDTRFPFLSIRSTLTPA